MPPPSVDAGSVSVAAAPAGVRPASSPGVGWLVLAAAPTALGANAAALVLPDAAGALGSSAVAASWIAIAFGWAIVVATPLIAGLLRRGGPRAALRTSVLLAAGGSLLVAFAPSLAMLVLGRAAQGAGGAGLIMLAMGSATSRRELGLITAGTGAAGAIGPMLGPVLADIVSWRAGLLLSALALAAVPALARSIQRGGSGADEERFDIRGAAGVVALVSGVVLIPRIPVAAVAGTFVAIAFLVMHLRRRPLGFVPLPVLRAPGFVAAAAASLALSCSYFALLYAVPRLLAQHVSWTTHEIGVAQMLALLVGSSASWLLAASAQRASSQRVLIAIFGAGTVAPVSIAVTASTPILVAAPAFAVFACTAGLATLTAVAARPVAAQHRVSAIGLVSVSYQLGGALGPGLAALLATG